MNNLAKHIKELPLRGLEGLLVGLALLLMTACSKDEDVVPAVFPDKQVVDVKAGDETSFTFTASADNWELISEQPVWCRLTLEDQVNMPSVVGNSGNVTVKVSISDDMSSYIEKSTADLTLRIGKEEKVIGTIVRSDINTYVIVRQDGEVIPEGGNIVIDADGEAVIEIETNFGAPDMVCSDWFEMTGDEGVYTLRLAEGISQKYPRADGTISFSLLGSRAISSHSYNVSYTGMDPQTLKITGYVHKDPETGIEYKISAFGWEVDSEGKEMTYVRANGDIVTVWNTMPVTVDALNDDIVFAYVEDEVFKQVTGKEYFHVKQEKSDVSITIDALSADVKSRAVTIYAFAREKWNNVKGLSVPEEDPYNKDAVMSFTQKVAAVGFEVTYYDRETWEQMTLDVFKETSQTIIDKVRTHAAGARDIYSIDGTALPVVKYNNTRAFTVNTLLSPNDWEVGTTAEAYKLLDVETGEDLKDKTGFSLSPGMSTAGLYQFDVTIPATMTSPAMLVLYDPNDMSKVVKVLVVEN